MASAKRLYRTETSLIRTLRVAYPPGRGRMVLRTEQDWERDLEPVAVSEGDNYEVAVGMAMALIARGWEYGRNLLHLCFPNAGHSESAWGTRLHLPLQFLHGAVARAYRSTRPVLGDRPS